MTRYLRHWAPIWARCIFAGAAVGFLIAGVLNQAAYDHFDYSQPTTQNRSTP